MIARLGSGSRLNRKGRLMLADYLYAAVREQLGRDYTIVDAPGQGVLRLRAAITEAKGAKVVLDTLSNILPPAIVLSSAKRLAIGTHAFVGKVRVETEILDSVSGVRLVAAYRVRGDQPAMLWRFGAEGDTSEHDWLEARARRLSLVTMIDDATGRKHSRFFVADTTEANMAMIAQWIGQFGRPVALYTD